MPSPRENSALWDYVVIGSVVLPPDGVDGHVTVEAPIEFELDPKKAKGKNGSRTTSQGRKGATKVKIKVTFTDALTSTGESQYDLVNDAISKITEKPGPYGVAHGATDFAAVKDIMIESVSSPEWDGGQGTISIDAQRWDAPATIAGAGGKGSGAPASLLAQLAAAEAELAALLASNIQDQTAVLLAQSKVLSLKALVGTYGTATSTPTKSDPTKGYSQGGGAGGPSTPGIPLGEIQPTGTV
jgi:hypothetical protein